MQVILVPYVYYYNIPCQSAKVSVSLVVVVVLGMGKGPKEVN
jgi:hypothetical protein